MLGIQGYGSGSESEGEGRTHDPEELSHLKPLPVSSSINNLTMSLCAAPTVVSTVSNR